MLHYDELRETYGETIVLLTTIADVFTEWATGRLKEGRVLLERKQRSFKVALGGGRPTFGLLSVSSFYGPSILSSKP